MVYLSTIIIWFFLSSLSFAGQFPFTMELIAKLPIAVKEVDSKLCEISHCGNERARLHQRPICGVYSALLSRALKKQGIPNWLWESNGHAYLTTRTVDATGHKTDWIIDGTFRQFFVPHFSKEADLSSLPEKFDELGIPEVLLVPLDHIKSALESFPIPPGWVEYPHLIPSADYWYKYVHPKPILVYRTDMVNKIAHNEDWTLFNELLIP